MLHRTCYNQPVHNLFTKRREFSRLTTCLPNRGGRYRRPRGVFMFRFVCFAASLSLAGSLSAQMEPNAGRWKTWVIPAGGTLRLAAPPNDATTAAEILQIKSAIAQLDTATVEQIHFWDAGAPGYRWMQMTEQ